MRKALKILIIITFSSTFFCAVLGSYLMAAGKAPYNMIFNTGIISTVFAIVLLIIYLKTSNKIPQVK